MTDRTRYLLLIGTLAVVSLFEFIPRLRPGWTFVEAMNWGGLTFVTVFVLLFLRRPRA